MMKVHPSEDTMIRVRRTLFGNLIYSVLVWNPADNRYYIQLESGDLPKMERMEKLIAQQIGEEKRLKRAEKLRTPKKKTKEEENGNQTRYF